MSVAQIKEEILHLSADDRREVEEFLRRMAQNDEVPPMPPAGRKLSHEEAMDYVFTEFAPVLSRLAQ